MIGKDRRRTRGQARQSAQGEDRKVPVIFDPRVAGSLIGHLASAANGASIARKSSFLRETSSANGFSRPASASSTIR